MVARRLQDSIGAIKKTFRITAAYYFPQISFEHPLAAIPPSRYNAVRVNANEELILP